MRPHSNSSTRYPAPAAYPGSSVRKLAAVAVAAGICAYRGQLAALDKMSSLVPSPTCPAVLHPHVLGSETFVHGTEGDAEHRMACFQGTLGSPVSHSRDRKSTR